MKILRGLLLGGCVLTLAACSNTRTELNALNEAQSVGSPFTQKLTSQYRTFANGEMAAHDYPDALHFARKGLATSAGNNVLPEPVSDWNLDLPSIQELSTARGRLMAALDNGAREIAPEQAANAQYGFDCWIEQQEEKWQTQDIAACKNEFMTSMNTLEGMVSTAPPPAPMPEPAQAPAPTIADAVEPMTAEDAMYLVFFDFDKSGVTAGGQSIIDTVAQEAKAQNPKIIRIIGHTDSAGPENYNDKLALQRAEAVKQALSAKGVDASSIQVTSRGEAEPLVQTADNIREPSNRRAQISFE